MRPANATRATASSAREESDSRFTGHEPCPSCGSGDNLARYDDGHGYCFGCNYFEESPGSPSAPPRNMTDKAARPLVTGGKPFALKSRGLTEETCRKWNYEVAKLNGKYIQIANYFDDSRRVVAQKIRYEEPKDFRTVGDWKAVGLYGKWLWGGGGKKVIVTEGEIDALSVSQMQGHKWPVVSVPSGAAAAKAAFKRDLEWLESFEEVVLMFDMDEPGQSAAQECASILSPGKCKIAKLHDAKDANDLLVAGRGDEIIKAVWNAQEIRPDGIVAGEDAWQYLLDGDNIQTALYPWDSLNNVTHGLRVGEIVTVIAGTGVGKSTTVKEIEKHLWDKGERIGHIALEENVRQSMLAFMSLHLNKRLHLLGNKLDTAELRPTFDEIMRDERLFFYDSWGSIDPERLKELIRYLARSRDCRWVVLDHISIVVSGMETGDERRSIDNLMTGLRSLVEELQVGLILISHLKRTQGTPAEEGGEIRLQDIRGSQAIAQLSDMVIALERNQQDPASKFITRVRVLKNRFSGDTGIAGYLHWNDETGRTVEGPPPPDEDDSGSEAVPVGDGEENDIPF